MSHFILGPTDSNRTVGLKLNEVINMAIYPRALSTTIFYLTNKIIFFKCHNFLMFLHLNKENTFYCIFEKQNVNFQDKTIQEL